MNWWCARSLMHARVCSNRSEAVNRKWDLRISRGLLASEPRRLDKSGEPSSGDGVLQVSKAAYPRRISPSVWLSYTRSRYKLIPRTLGIIPEMFMMSNTDVHHASSPRPPFSFTPASFSSSAPLSPSSLLGSSSTTAKCTLSHKLQSAQPTITSP